MFYFSLLLLMLLLLMDFGSGYGYIGTKNNTSASPTLCKLIYVVI